MALLTSQEEWLDNMDRNLENILITLDMSAAFDTIRQKMRLKKLRIYGGSESTLKLLESYLRVTSRENQSVCLLSGIHIFSILIICIFPKKRGVYYTGCDIPHQYQKGYCYVI